MTTKLARRAPRTLAPIQASDVLACSFLKIKERLDLTDIEASVFVGVAPHTIRVVRLTKRSPTRAPARAKLALFVAKNRNAKSRGDVVLCGGAP